MVFCCEEMTQHIVDTTLIQYSEIFDEYATPYSEDHISVQLIQYCPWCGRKLPDSKRYDWFEELELLGYENPLLRDDIPAAYKSGQWRKSHK